MTIITIGNEHGNKLTFDKVGGQLRICAYTEDGTDFVPFLITPAMEDHIRIWLQ